MGEPVRPSRDIAFTETPEFKAAVAEAAREAAREAFAQFAAAGQAGPTGDAQALARELALAIAEMSHQGSPRDKPIDPKVLAERKDATDRMRVIIAEAKALPSGHPDRPRYKCRSKVNLSDHMIDPFRRDNATRKAIPIEFQWALEPNDAMIPLNDMAHRIFAEFRASRGNLSDYSKEPRKQAWLSDGGLLIEGAPPARRETPKYSESDDPKDLTIDLGFGPGDPNATHVRVLGTIHPAARQNHHGELN